MDTVIKKLFLFILTLFVSCGLGMAQNVTMSMEEWKEHENKIDSLEQIIVLLRTELSGKDTIIETQNDEIGKLNSHSMKITTLQDENKVLRAEKEESERKYQEVEKRFEEELDMMNLRLINTRLFQKYNKKNIDDAIDIFNKISNSQIKTDYKEVLDLLKIYELSNDELLQVMIKAQEDSDRAPALGGGAKEKDYKQRLTRDIQGTRYFNTYYKKAYSIRYLDDIITKVLSMIEEHTYKQPVNFTGIIADLTPNK